MMTFGDFEPDEPKAFDAAIFNGNNTNMISRNENQEWMKPCLFQWLEVHYIDVFLHNKLFYYNNQYYICY